MLLHLLSKEEKFCFLDLLYKVFFSDGPASEYEKKAIQIFKTEMGSDIDSYRKSNRSTDELIGYLSEKSKAIKNIVYYNISWASLSDEFYSVEKHLILDEIQHEFKITKTKKIELLQAVYAERDLKEKIKRIVIE